MQTSISTPRSVEVLPVLGGHRQWPSELKARIVAPRGRAEIRRT